MDRNQILLALASDQEISALGFASVEEAVEQYSFAASHWFKQCRFVPFGLQACVEGVLDEDYVLVVTGVNRLNARIGTFGDRPSNIRGWILFSNSNYILESFDMTFGHRGGDVVYVDQYMCDATGAPVLQEGDWEFTDYFGEQDEITYCGATYVKAWDVVRTNVPYAKQNITTIESITWVGTVPHTLADGSTLSVAGQPKRNKSVVLDTAYAELYEAFGSPQMTNGSSVRECVVNPVFLHALIQCKCGNTHWTVGDWSGYKSLCCGFVCKPKCCVSGDVKAGDVVVTSQRVGSGLKYYNGMVLKFVGKRDGVSLWRVSKVQAVDGFVASATFDPYEHSQPLADGFVACSFDNVSAAATSFKYGLLTGVFDDLARKAITDGLFDVGNCVVDVVDQIFAVQPSFVRRMQELFGAGWDVLVTAVKSLSCCVSDLIKFAKSLASATLVVVSGKIQLLATVPECFQSVYSAFRDFVTTVFDLTVKSVTIAGLQLKAVGDYLLFDNAIVKLVSVKVKGMRQHGVNQVEYATVVYGPTQKVSSSRVEVGNVDLVAVDDSTPLVTSGVTVCIGGRAFFYSGGCYRLMSDNDAVLETPVFRSLESLTPEFDCPKPDDFPGLVATDLADLCVLTEKALAHYTTQYRTFFVSVFDEKCVVKHALSFQAPDYIVDSAKFCDACNESYLKPGFDLFYREAHAAKDLAGLPEFPGFEQFMLPICPAILTEVDGGGIWNTFVSSVSNAVEFCRGLKISFGIDGFVFNTVKRFRRVANALCALYNAFVESVKSVFKAAGLSFVTYAFVKPMIVINGTLHKLGVMSRKDCDIPCENTVGEWTVICDGTCPVTPSRVEQVSVSLEEVEFVEPPSNGYVAIVDGTAFYTDNNCYYPCDMSTCVPVCYKKVGGGKLQFAEDVKVLEIDPVYKVRLNFEFEDETLADVCEQTIGHKITFNGNTWEGLCDLIRSALAVVSEHVELPEVFIYDEEGGNDISKPVMVSQWPLESSEEPEPSDVPDIDDNQEPEETPEIVVDEVTEVNDALSFIVETPPTVVENPFAFEFYELNGVKVLKQSHNNCWVASTCVQLQLLDVLVDSAFDLFKAGRVAPFVQKCYEVTGNIKGSLGDTAHCLEQLLKEMHTMFIECETECDCGKNVVQMSGAVFRFMPTAKPFPYGACATCGKVLLHTITSLEGSGVFCQEPEPFDFNALLCQPICASVYSGAASGGHYRTNIYSQKLCVDGHGPRKIKSTCFNTVCFKGVSYRKPIEVAEPVEVVAEPEVASVPVVRPEPFASYKNVEFYQGSVDKLVCLSHDFLVNAANDKLQHNGGVAKAINDLTGGELQTISNGFIATNGPVKVGCSAMLKCGSYNILNVVGPRKGKHAADLLTKAYSSLFEHKGVPLTPLLSVGIFKVPLQDSLSALFATVADRHVKCFCLTDGEREGICKFLDGLKPVEKPAEKPVEKPVEEVVPVEIVPVTPRPFRVEGRTEFYNCPMDQIILSNPDRIVVFTDGTLSFCSVAKAVDSFVEGAITQCVLEFQKTTPVVPPGNLVTFKCDGVVTFVMAVLPKDDDKAYDKNLARTLNKVCKLKGTIYMAFPTAHIAKKLVDMCNARFIALDESVIDECFCVESTVVKVSADGRSVSDVVVCGKQTFEEQLGPCTTDNKDVSAVVPTDGITTVINVAPPVDWHSFYGFTDCDVFHTMNHSEYAFDNMEVNGKRVLKFSDNNCWVNTTCLQLQYARVTFAHEGLQDMWDHYLVGDVAKFVHWLYWLNFSQKGEPGDVESTLNLLSKFIVNQGSVTLVRTTSDDCCPTRRVVNCAVVNASVLRHGFEEGYCAHGLPYVNRVGAVKGTAIVVNVGKPVVVVRDALLKGESYTTYAGTIERGHYTVFDNESGRVHDGSDFAPGDLSTMAVTSLVVRNRTFSDPIKRVERKATEFVKTLDVASDQFFAFGDVVSRNVITVFLWLFSMLSIIFKAFKNRDLKVFALAPERTGVILSRSLRYNLKACKHVCKLKMRWVTLFFKFLVLLYTLYAVGFLFIRFGPANGYVCDDYVSGYVESNFDKNSYCKSPLCKVCLYGYQELSEFPHTNTVWEHLKDPLVGNVVPLFYLAFLAIFGGLPMKIVVCYFVAQYVNIFGSKLGVQDNVWLLQFIPFSVFGDEIVVCFIVFKALCFLRHVLFGCDKASCVACCKSARLQRVPMQTIVNGASKSFYVMANGGKSFCKKHNFFCLNCDSYGPGTTFINEVIAKEVSNVTKTNVQPTSTACVDIDKVEFSNGFYYLYSGETFWKYNFDITEAKYSCKDVLKNCNIVSDFIVYNNSGSNVTQVRNACVYLSQLLCKPIKLVDSALLATLNVDFNGALHAAFVEVLNDSFSKDLSGCTTMADCKQTLGLDVSDDDFVNAVSNAHRYNVLLTDVSYNNFVTSYAKPEEKLSTHDLATCMRAGAKVVNHNVLVKENMPVVWAAREFNLLSEECRKYLIKTSKAKGVNFMLTFNDNKMQTPVPAVSITAKQGAGILPTCYRFLWWLCLAVIIVFFSVSLLSFEQQVTSQNDFDFKYIENGVLKVFTGPLDCVHNVFDNFAAWHDAKFGVVPKVSARCPIVVGVADDVRMIPGVASGVKLVGKTLVFALQSVFGDSGLCYDLQGLTTTSSCIFNSACTILSGVGGKHTYCYKDGLVPDSKLYSDILPNSHYKLEDGNYIKLPEVLTRGFGFRTIRTVETTYCRMGQCIDSKAGVCFGADRFFVYSAEAGSDFICGTGLVSLLYNIFNIFSGSFSVMALSGQIIFNLIVAAVVVLSCFMVTKFKRVFGDLSFAVFTVCTASFMNSISYIITQNYCAMYVYAFLYFMATRNVRYAWIWHVSFVIAYFTLAPWWLIVWYVCATCVGLIPSLMKLKVSTQLFEGDKFVGTFESAAAGTFVMDMHSYQRLVNSIAPEKLKQYAASYNRYKYYSGSASEADYRLACFAHLAKAMLDYGTNHQDMLYTPPTVSYNSTLQSGLRKMAQPSGVVEKCVVRVSYGNMTLNGIWLGDTVICPRHVIASSTTSTIDYEHEASVMRLHNFSIAVGNVFLGVVGVAVRGCNLHIKVNQSNVNTPKYSFRTLKAGESFNILACYDGVPAGVYGVTLRTNNTVRGSFINGACGSPGYNIVGGTVEFCYLHQLELGSGCHVGSNLEGVMYGGFEDQPTLQVEGASNLVTVNVISFLYGALLNGVTWWLTSERITIDAYNEWAQQNGFTQVSSVDCFTILAAKTGVDVQRILAAVQRLHKGFGGKSILGFTSLTDEFTTAEVIQQMYGVNLQSGKVTSTFKNLLLVGTFFVMLWSELMMFTPFFWVSPGFVTPIFALLVMLSIMFTGFIKHKVLYLYTFLIPAVVVTSCCNFLVELAINSWLASVLDYHASIMSVDIQGVINVLICVIVTLLHTYRFAKAGFVTYVTYCLSLLVVFYNWWFHGDLLSLFMMLLLNVSDSWYVGAIAYRISLFAATQFPMLELVVGKAKVVIFIYVAIGFLCCMYYGILYWINRFCKLTLGVYDFKVSANEFKYMVANGLRAPRGVFDSMLLSMKLVGIGGEKVIKVSTVQSKLTDIKCTNVVLLGCLSSMNIAANTREWAYCVELHNKINLCDDPEKAQEMLLALLAFFISKQKDFGIDDLIDSYFDSSSVLQSVASTFVNMPSYMAYESARQSYEDAVNNGSSPQLIKQLKRAMNIAKAEFDHESSVQKKINRMAEQAAAQMFKEARAVNRKSKIISAMHSLLFSMLRRLDMSSVDTILNLAKDGIVPLSVIPATCATKLSIVSSDFTSFAKIVKDGCVHYAGVVWSISEITDADGKVVHLKEVVEENAETLTWPLFVNCVRVVKLQNNEIIPGKLKQRVVKAEGDGFSVEGKALFNNEGGKTFMYAFVADKPDLKYVKWEFDGGCNTIELEPPCRFAVETANGTVIKYLYFVRNLNTLRRGAVLGFIGATVRLQAGKQTELASNSALLTMCAFAVDPAKTYIDAVKKGVKPVGNCVKMLSNGSGTGQAITVGVEANSNQDSYGGASVCLYCRAHVEHPTMDGTCRYKGKYVQVPIGNADPIRFCLENEPCKVCMCWLNNGCTCDRTSIQSVDMSYLNEHGALVQLD